MTRDDMLRRLEQIRACASNDEKAHRLEDNLYRDVLCAIADGEAVDPQALAGMALATQAIGFARWCG